MKIFSQESQIIFGTLLGNSKLIKYKGGVCLWMRSKDQMWLNSKTYDLSSYEDERWFGKNVYHWRSVPHESFNDFDDKFYKNGSKIISFDVLDCLRDIAIAVWYGDCGCLVGRTRQNACLRTQAFGQKGNRIICDWFNSVGIDCNLNKHRNSNVVVFTLKGTKILLEMVAPLMPKNRHHLIC